MPEVAVTSAYTTVVTATAWRRLDARVERATELELLRHAVDDGDDVTSASEPSFAKMVAADVSPVASAFSSRTKTSMPSARNRAAHSSMKDRSYG